MPNKMRPIHPGEVLKEELAGLGVSANVFAQALAVPTNRITSILNEQRAVTADTALRLARYFGTTPEFWMNLQTAYDVKIARQSNWSEIEQVVKPAVKTAA
jgi:addiction module HigA family antidote